MDKLDKLLKEWAKRRKPDEAKLQQLTKKICCKVRRIKCKDPRELKN